MGQCKILKKGAVPTLFLPKRIFDKSPLKRQISRRLKNSEKIPTKDENEIKEDAATEETIFGGIAVIGVEVNIHLGETIIDKFETDVRSKAAGTQTLVSSIRSQLLSATFLTDNQLKHFTGYTRNEFIFLLNFFKCIPRSTNSALPMEDEMLLCLMMYRQKYYFSSLEVFFNVGRRVVQKIFQYWTNKLYRALKIIDFWKCRHKKLKHNYNN
ncbi:hypothetical protein NQ314_019977 [Rhamnusium bicolor]|uniref:Transposase Helix-turn-helix domain-containing protein n=1 Tax=Rhamnusium bicolor TaxID=1586634 RepID=A0AAV8WM28_9CUCU|nr:hypothetical protein NQ314_019977 [Rhamnusium bicolor]